MSERTRFVTVSGELDLATSDELFQACIGGENSDVILNLWAVTFMDCVA